MLIWKIGPDTLKTACMCTVALMVPLSTKVLMGADKCNSGGREGSDELESHPGGVELLLVANCNTT